MPSDSPAPLLLSRLSAVLAARRARIEELLAAGDPTEEALHDLRVALRRTAAVARLTRGVPREGDGEALRRLARDLRRSLSAQRTREVCAAVLARRFRDAPRREAARRLASRLREVQAESPPPAPRLGALRQAFAVREGQLLGHDPSQAERLERRLRQVVSRRLKRKRKRFLAAGVPQADGVHASRIAAKELRYALELVAEALPGSASLLPLLAEYQDRAGAAHDRQELVHELTRLLPHLPRPLARSARGLLPVLSSDAERAVARAQVAARRLLEALGGASLELPTK